jgi:hypothetical protein
MGSLGEGGRYTIGIYGIGREMYTIFMVWFGRRESSSVTEHLGWIRWKDIASLGPVVMEVDGIASPDHLRLHIARQHNEWLNAELICHYRLLHSLSTRVYCAKPCSLKSKYHRFMDLLKTPRERGMYQTRQPPKPRPLIIPVLADAAPSHPAVRRMSTSSKSCVNKTPVGALPWGSGE